MAGWLGKFLFTARRFAAATAGGVMPIYGLALVSLLGMSGLALDYSNMSRWHNKLQNTADATALATAQELRLANVSASRISSYAKSYAATQMNDEGIGEAAIVSASLGSDGRSVTVHIDSTVPTYLAKSIGIDSAQVSVDSVARLVGGMPLCLVGLDPKDSGTIRFDGAARLQAPGCAIYSDSTNPQGLKANNKGQISAGYICTSGGKVGAPTAFSPQPELDCPPVPDPLANRAPPPVIGCDRTNLVLSGGVRSLMPGIYCGGLTIQGGAAVTLQPGTYIIKDGPLKVTGGASIKGVYVGFYLTGSGATINFTADSSISLTAPKTGPLASLLFFEDRAAPLLRNHVIESNDARQLLGTIYLSRGSFYVDANNPIADKSAYTVIVARKVEADQGPTLVLNTNYGASDIPVPDGLGPKTGTARLER